MRLERGPFRIKPLHRPPQDHGLKTGRVEITPCNFGHLRRARRAAGKRRARKAPRGISGGNAGPRAKREAELQYREYELRRAMVRFVSYRHTLSAVRR